MRRSTKRNADTGLLRRLPKQNAPVNARWMHCGAGEISVLYTLHALIGESMQQYVIYSTGMAVRPERPRSEHLQHCDALAREPRHRDAGECSRPRLQSRPAFALRDSP